MSRTKIDSRLFIIFLGLAAPAVGQSASLTLSSASTAQGGTASLNLSLTSSTGGQPASLQWTFTYSTSDIVSVSVTAGPAATGAGKSVVCAASSGSYMCLLSGINTNLIPNGTVAVASIKLSSTVTTSTAIGVKNPIAAAANGTAISITGAGGSITVTSGVITLKSLSCNPTSLTTPGSSTCTVTLSQAPSSNTAVTLSDNSSYLTVPTSVTVPSGATSAKFSASAAAVTTTQTAVVTAKLGSSSQTASLTLAPALTISSLRCSPTSLVPPATSACTVTLGHTPSSNTAVALSDNSSYVTVPASVTVAAGTASISFSASASAVTTTQTAVITATLGSSSQTVSLVLTPPLAISSLQCSPTTLLPSSTSTCMVMLNRSTPSNTGVTLSDNSTNLTIPSSVTLPAGTSSATFSATAGQFNSTQTALITATLGSSFQSVSLTLAPSLTISSLQCPASLVFGASGTCIVAMNGVAPKQITVSISDNSKALLTPSSVKVPAGYARASFSVVAGSVAAQVTITATYNKVSKWATISISAAQKTTTSTSSASFISSLACSPSTLVGSSTANCTVGLAQPAAAAGTSIALATDSNLQVPGTVSVSPGSKSAQFSVRGWASDTDQPAEILATTTDGAATAKLSIIGIKPVSLSCRPNAVEAGDPVTCEVQLNSDEIPDVLTLWVTSSSADIQVPASVTTRPRQSTLSLQADSSPGSKQQSTALQIGFGNNTIQDSVITRPASVPVLTLPGPQMAKSGVPVSFIVSALDSSDGTVSVMASMLPAGASFDPAGGTFQWTPTPAQAGQFDITFTAVNSLRRSATGKVRILVGSGEPVTTELVNAASQDPKFACSPGGIASLLGTWLVQDNSTWSDPSGQATDLGGTQVRVNGQAVPILYASGSRVDFECPRAVAGSSLDVVLSTAAGQTKPITTPLQDVAPGILTVDGSGQGQGLILFPDTSAVAIVRNPLVPGEPAQPGDTLAIRATGISAEAQVSVETGGVWASVQSIRPGNGTPGVYEVLVTVPAGVPFGGTVPVKLQVVRAGGQVRESNVVTMAVEAVRP